MANKWVLTVVAMVALLKASSCDAILEPKGILDTLLGVGERDQSFNVNPEIQDVPHFVVRCGDCMEWHVSKAYQSKFGRQLTGNLSVAQCQRACVLNTKCVGIDYDRSADPCWLHLDVKDFINIYPVRHSDIDQYRLNRRCKTSSDAGLTCERVFQTCYSGADFYKSACLDQASLTQQNFVTYLEAGLVSSCQEPCGNDVDCLAACDVIRSNQQSFSSQQHENAVSTCNTNFDLLINECNKNFLMCV